MSSTFFDNNDIFINGNSMTYVPVGSIFIWLTNTLPSSSYVWCDGSILDKNTYISLFNTIGYEYGGSGNNFNTPNLVSKFPMGGNYTGTNPIGNIDTDPSASTTTKSGGNSTILPEQFVHKHFLDKQSGVITNTIITNNTDYDTSDYSFERGGERNPTNISIGNSTATTHLPPHKRVNYIMFAGKLI